MKLIKVLLIGQSVGYCQRLWKICITYWTHLTSEQVHTVKCHCFLGRFFCTFLHIFVSLWILEFILIFIALFLDNVLKKSLFL